MDKVLDMFKKMGSWVVAKVKENLALIAIVLGYPYVQARNGRV